MVKAKCIEKVRNKSNVIIGYTLQDNTGYTITVEPKQLKEKILSGEVEIVNLKLTPSGRLIDKSIEDTIKGYSIMNTDTKADVNQYNKTLILGVAPTLNDAGYVTDVSGNKVIFTDMTNKFAGNIYATRTIAEFNGGKELEKDLVHIGITLVFKEVVVNNPCVMQNINNKDGRGIRVLAPKIIINHNLITVKTIDEVFKILKNQFDNYSFNSMFIVIINTNNLDKEEVFDRTFKILKRQKVSSKEERRCYDLMVYLEFIYSMWLSTGSSDNRYVKLAKKYLYELKLYHHLLYGRHVDSYLHAVLYIKDHYINTIINDMELGGNLV